VNKRQKRKWESAKRRRQEDCRHPIYYTGVDPTYYTGVDPMDVLRRILPEASSDVPSQLRCKPERLTFWQRVKMFFTG